MTQTGPTSVNFREGGETKNGTKNEAFGERGQVALGLGKMQREGKCRGEQEVGRRKSVTSKAYTLIALYSKGLSLCGLLSFGSGAALNCGFPTQSSGGLMMGY